MPCGSTSGNWRSEPGNKTTATAIRDGRKRAMNRTFNGRDGREVRESGSANYPRVYTHGKALYSGKSVKETRLRTDHLESACSFCGPMLSEALVVAEQ
jgi:hypothetical protein